MRLKEGGLPGYRRFHDEIWSELIDEIERSGVAQISIFENDPVLFVYSEIRDPEAWERLWSSEVHRRWGEVMDQFIDVDEAGAPRAGQLREVFHLESGRPEHLGGCRTDLKS